MGKYFIKDDLDQNFLSERTNNLPSNQIPFPTIFLERIFYRSCK